MIVLDASAALELLLRAATHERLVHRLLESGELLAAPHLLDLEIAQVLRRFAAAGDLSDARLARAIAQAVEVFGLSRSPAPAEVFNRAFLPDRAARTLPTIRS